MEKNNNLTTILLTILIAFVALFAGYYFGNKNVDKINTDQTANNNKQTTDCDETTNSESKQYMHVFTFLNDFKGYNIYAFLNNQGSEMQVFDYNGELYETQGNDSDQCIADLVDGEAKFKNNSYNCAYSMDDEDDEDREATAVLIKLNIKTKAVKAVKLINSCRSDGAPFTLIVKNDGTVSYLDTIEGGREVKDNYFKEYSIKDITSFRCENQQEAGYKNSVFTVLLEDDTTKEITK